MINKKNSLLFFLLFFVSSTFFYAQDLISVSFHQDLKLLAFGDDLGNRSGTLDLITRIKYEGKDKKIGFIVLGIEYERANIKDGFTRYSGFFGYSINPFFNETNLYITPAIGFGNIARRKQISTSWSGSLQIAYKLSNSLKISSLIQYTERSDLKTTNNKNETRYSFFIGLNINLFRFTR